MSKVGSDQYIINLVQSFEFKLALDASKVILNPKTKSDTLKFFSNDHSSMISNNDHSIHIRVRKDEYIQHYIYSYNKVAVVRFKSPRVEEMPGIGTTFSLGYIEVKYIKK